MPGGHAQMTKRLGPACGGRSALECCTSYADTRAIRLYFDEGQKVRAEADFSDANIYDQSFHFSGFLTYK